MSFRKTIARALFCSVFNVPRIPKASQYSHNQNSITRKTVPVAYSLNSFCSGVWRRCFCRICLLSSILFRTALALSDL